MNDEDYDKLGFWDRYKYEWEHSGVFEKIWMMLHQITEKEVTKDDRIQVSRDKEARGIDNGTG